MIGKPKDKTRKIKSAGNFFGITSFKNVYRGVKLEFKHKPVMLEECINGLKIEPSGIYIDGTLRRSWT